MPKTKKKKAAVESNGKGRTSAYSGKKLKKLGKLMTKEGDINFGHVLNAKGESMGRLRDSGFTRECWDAIKDGLTVDTYRANTSNPSIARKVLADFIAKGFVEVAA